jgi:dUTP pyrophosphatase
MLKIKRLRETATLPTRAHSRDSGLDLHSSQYAVIGARSTATVPIGIAMDVPEGFEIQIRPRSGLSSLGIMACFGTVDSSYRGEIRVTLVNHNNQEYSIGTGDRIAQAVIAKVELWTPVVCDSLSDTGRGSKGFGSSGI